MASALGTKRSSTVLPSASANGAKPIAKKAGPVSMRARLPTARNRPAKSVRYTVRRGLVDLCNSLSENNRASPRARPCDHDLLVPWRVQRKRASKSLILRVGHLLSRSGGNFLQGSAMRAIAALSGCALVLLGTWTSTRRSASTRNEGEFSC